ncbi:MAG: pseudouridine synthase [Marinifilaceae bacterium]
MIHYFKHPINHIPLPHQFTFPFHYTPHALCELAAQEVQEYIAGQPQWLEELNKGKMFGVLIVRTSENEIGFLAAYSGNLCHSNSHKWFVPAVFDLLNPQGYFVEEEAKISAINKEITTLTSNETYIQLKARINADEINNKLIISQAKEAIKKAKDEREQTRQTTQLTPEELNKFIKESQFQKAELKRLEKRLTSEMNELKEQFLILSNKIELLKKERKERSGLLQQWLFRQFSMLNANGERKDLNQIFTEYGRPFPPAGAGECAGPKLLQYAFNNNLHPLAMAEFWWGNSPKTEIRHHKQYYPACSGKCEPILTHMLKGLNVAPNPLLCEDSKIEKLLTIYEDEWILIINKPAGMLSVPGKSNCESVYSIIRDRYPNATGPLLVHRLDMATSGLLVIAKEKEVHRKLQIMFRDRTIQKCYHALLEGHNFAENGTINLPLRPDIINRPRQLVDFDFGKTATTRYEVIRNRNNRVAVSFYPLTGRTHQLRVHAAHELGLNAPIVGDDLYGTTANRLYLHAFSLRFIHPVTHREIYVEATDYDIL